MCLLGTVQIPDDTATKVMNYLIKVLAYVPLAYAILLLTRYLWKRFAPLLSPNHPPNSDTDDAESTTDILEA